MLVGRDVYSERARGLLCSAQASGALGLQAWCGSGSSVVVPTCKQEAWSCFGLWVLFFCCFALSDLKLQAPH